MVAVEDTIRGYFEKLGLETEIADIYLSLYSQGPQSISQLSRTSRVERTRIYPLIDSLLSSNLIEIDGAQKRGIIKAAPIANLNILIHQKEQDLQALKDDLGLIEQVLARNSLSSPALQLQTYRGQESVHHLLAQELQAKGEIVGTETPGLSSQFGATSYNRWLAGMDKAGKHRRLITNQPAKSSAWAAYRAINEETLTIDQSCHVYDDRVAYFIHKDGEIYGLSVINPSIAAQQKQLFELVWSQAAEK